MVAEEASGREKARQQWLRIAETRDCQSKLRKKKKNNSESLNAVNIEQSREKTEPRHK